MKRKITSVALTILLLIANAFTLVYAEGLETVEVDSSTNIASGPVGDQVSIALDETTNLLINSLGEDVTTVQDGRDLHELDSVTITRHRPKVTIEYYYGDYSTYDFVGSYGGYIDYDEYFSDYFKSIPQINETFGTNLPTTDYLMLRLDSNGSLVPRYNGQTNEYTVKILIGNKVTRSVFISTYMNRQDKQNPNPIGMSRTELNDKATFFNYNNLSTRVTAIENTPITIRRQHGITDSRTERGRTGQLSYLGIYDDAGAFYESEEYILNESLPSTIYVASIYEVDDYGDPVVEYNPSSSTTSGSTVGFITSDKTPTWKTPTVSETLLLSDELSYSKLENYPFNLDGDPFDNTEYDPYWPPYNWLTGHKLDIHYEYSSTVLPLPKYNVSFDSNGGNDITGYSDIEEGSLIQIPETPTRFGYTFVSWQLDGVDWDFDTDKVMSTMTLKAKWNPIPSFTVTFDSAGGNDIESYFNVMSGTTIKAPISPSRDGYRFVSWQLNGIDWRFAADKVTSNITLRALWEAIETPIETYTVSFDTDGGSSVAPYENVKAGSIIQMPETPHKDGYTFISWQLDGVDWNFDTDRVHETMTLKATWEKYVAPVVKHTVGFDSNGGSVVPTVTVEHNGLLTTPKEPVREGYTFVSWQLSNKDWNFETDHVTRDMILKATWKLNEKTPVPEKETPKPGLPATGVQDNILGYGVVTLGILLLGIESILKEKRKLKR